MAVRNAVTFWMCMVALAIPLSGRAMAAVWTPAAKAPAPLAEQLNGIRSSGTDFFFAHCEIGDHMKAALIVKVGSLVGQYFVLGDRSPDGTAVLADQGEVNLKNGVAVEWWSGKAVPAGDKILGSLVRQPMFLLLATETDIVFKRAPSASCSKPAFDK